MNKSPLIGLGCRMMNASCIGTCVERGLPHLLGENSKWQFVLLGKLDEVSVFAGIRLPSVIMHLFEAPIYSKRKQWIWLKLLRGRFGLLWVFRT